MRQHCCSLSGHLLDIVRQYFAYGLKPIFTLPADCEYSLFGSRPWVFIADSLDKLLSASGERACGHTRVASEPAASLVENSSCSFTSFRTRWILLLVAKPALRSARLTLQNQILGSAQLRTKSKQRNCPDEVPHHFLSDWQIA